MRTLSDLTAVSEFLASSYHKMHSSFFQKLFLLIYGLSLSQARARAQLSLNSLSSHLSPCLHHSWRFSATPFLDQRTPQGASSRNPGKKKRTYASSGSTEFHPQNQPDKRYPGKRRKDYRGSRWPRPKGDRGGRSLNWKENECTIL